MESQEEITQMVKGLLHKPWVLSLVLSTHRNKKNKKKAVVHVRDENPGVHCPAC